MAAVLILAFACPLAALQQGTPDASHPGNYPSGRGDIEDSESLRSKEFLEKFRLGREKERQKRIVDDANRLVQLTSEYQKSVAAHAVPTADDQRMLLQIEKLAREVKDRMRGM